jgi:hypothetical protein
MYQGRKLKYFYQIDKQNFVFHFDNNEKELFTFNSFYLKLGDNKITIDEVIYNHNNIHIKELSEISNKFARNLKNLSQNKMNSFNTLNKSNFINKSFYYKFNEDNDFINLAFDIECKEINFKIILLLKKDNMKIIPLVIKNTQKDIVISNYKIYKILENYSKNKLNKKLNNQFLNMLNNSEYLDQNSHYRFNLNNLNFF